MAHSRLDDDSVIRAAEAALVDCLADDKIEEKRKAAQYIMDRHKEVSGLDVEKLPGREDFERLGRVLEEIREVLQSEPRGLATRVST